MIVKHFKSMSSEITSELNLQLFDPIKKVVGWMDLLIDCWVGLWLDNRLYPRPMQKDTILCKDYDTWTMEQWEKSSIAIVHIKQAHEKTWSQEEDVTFN